MYLSRFHIQNFKQFTDITLYPTASLNVLTGMNNSGKTTILEAMSLWETCFYKLLNQARRDIHIKESNGNKKIIALAGNFKLGYVEKYDPSESKKTFVRSNDIVSIRTVFGEEYDIHSRGAIHSKIHLTAFFSNNREEKEISFVIQAQSAGNYSINFEQSGSYDFVKLNDFFQFPNPLSVIYASPIATLGSTEIFATLPQVKRKINARESATVLRNRLYQLYYDIDTSKWANFIRTLNFVLHNYNEEVSFEFLTQQNKDISPQIHIKTTSSGYFTDISLVGSGTLQMIEILLALNEDRRGLNMILLEEPDSYIHRDIQKRLLEILGSYDNTQIFVATHNESLIRSTPPQYLFHLDGNIQTEYRPIMGGATDWKERGFSYTPKIKLIESMGGENALDFLNAIEADKIILVEGADDAHYIETLLLTKYTGARMPNVMFWSFKGITNLFLRISAFKDIFSLIKNRQTLWSKCSLVFDRDYLTSQQRVDLMEEFSEKYNIPVYIWNAYTIEATLFTDIDKLALLIQRYIATQYNQQTDIELLKIVLSSHSS